MANHAPCRYRVRKKFGGAIRDFCCVNSDEIDLPFCTHCADRRKPCQHRRGDRCYAIGAFELGDLPCNDCAEEKQ